MRILANENFPGPVVTALRERGHDVLWARTDMRAATDVAILRQAQQDRRLVVTLDKDFGELAFHSGLTAKCGVMLFRLRMPDPYAAVPQMIGVIESRADWAGHFAVVENHRTRVRPIPAPTKGK